MDQKIKLGDKEYEIASLSEKAKKIFVALQFASNRIEELENMQALLQRAKNSYVYGFGVAHTFGWCLFFRAYSKDTFRQHRQKFGVPPHGKTVKLLCISFQILFQSVLL